MDGLGPRQLAQGWFAVEPIVEIGLEVLDRRGESLARSA
jgi:hypothetical protein